MKTKFTLILLLIAAFTSGCATVVKKRIDVEVQPGSALVEVYTMGYRKLVQDYASEGKTSFVLTGDPRELGQIRIQVSAEGYDDKEVYADANLTSLLKIVLEKSYQTISNERETDRLSAEQSKRDKYVIAHPDQPPAILDAIREGKIVAGMSWEQAYTSLGTIKFEMKSETADGSIELWAGQDTLYRYSLYFSRGWLLRWTTVAKY